MMPIACRELQGRARRDVVIMSQAAADSSPLPKLGCPTLQVGTSCARARGPDCLAVHPADRSSCHMPPLQRSHLRRSRFALCGTPESETDQATMARGKRLAIEEETHE
jgi:hypothetical protein